MKHSERDLSQKSLWRSPAVWVVLAGISVAMHIGKLPPAVSALREELQVSLVQAGFLLSMVQFAGMFLGLMVGLFADVIGLKRCMLTGMMLLSMASALGATAQTPATLLLTRFFEGLGFLLSIMPAPSLLKHLLSGERLAKMLGWWAAYMPIGAASALLAGPWVINALGWAHWWLILSGVTLLAFYMLLTQVPTGITSQAEGLISMHWGARLRLTLSSKGPWLIAFCFCLYSAQWISVIGFLPTITAEMGISATSSGVITALVAAVNILGNVASGFFLARSAKSVARVKEEALLKADMREDLKRQVQEQERQNPWDTHMQPNQGFGAYRSSPFESVQVPILPATALEQEVVQTPTPTPFVQFIRYIAKPQGMSSRLLLMGFITMAMGGALAFVQVQGVSLPVEWRFVSILLFSCVGGIVPGTLFSLAVKLSPSSECVAITVGWMQQCSSLGQFFGPPLVAWLAMLVGGWQWTWGVTALMAMVGLLMAVNIALILMKEQD
jgi:MFS family permease